MSIPLHLPQTLHFRRKAALSITATKPAPGEPKDHPLAVIGSALGFILFKNLSPQDLDHMDNIADENVSPRLTL